MKLNLFKPVFLFCLCVCFFCIQKAEAQIDCQIQVSSEMPVCNGSIITLSVAQNVNYSYLWSPNSETTSYIIIRPTETSTYSVKVKDLITGDSCLNSITVEVRPRFETSIEQVQLTCSNSENNNGNTAMLQASAVGDLYTYSWDLPPLNVAPGNPRLAVGLKAHLWYHVEITDQYGCRQTDSIYTKAYKNPIVEIDADPDTAYIQKPYITFSFENTSPDTITNFFWDFGDEQPSSSLETPRYTYNKEGVFTTLLTVHNAQGCDTVFAKEVTILPVKLKIPTIFTPNGDGVNDYFVITEAPADSGDTGEDLKSSTAGHYKPVSVYYERVELTIVNRWGRKVYESNDYRNDWDGGDLKDGTYFYVLKCKGRFDNHVYKGAVAIFGSGR